MDRFEYLIVGAGFAGSVCAEQLASAGKSVLLIDQRAHVGGNASDQYDDAGILVHRYGPHIFHTNSAAVLAYLSRFTGWRPYEHRVVAEIARGQRVPVPINRTTLAAFGDWPYDETCKERAIEAIYRPYTRKQWGCELEDLDPSVLARVTVRDSDDDRYFTDRYQCMPLLGYTRLFERLLDHPNIKILLKTTFQDVATYLMSGRRAHIICTGPIDEFFNYVFGKLPYRSAHFEFQTHRGAHDGCVSDCAVVNMPSPNVGFTRVTEFKHLTGQQHEQTTLAFEYPSADGDPFWPIPTSANAALYQRYKALAAGTPGVHFCGRLGTYQYLNIDQVVAQALKLSRSLLAQEETACQEA